MLFGGRKRASLQTEDYDGGRGARTKPRSGLMILAVDDDATSRAAIINTLEAAGYNVHAVSNYADWDMMRQSGMTPALLVLDIMLSEPRQGGYEILRTLRKADRTTPVVMLSSRNTPSDEAFAKANLANAFVSKAQGEFDNPERGLVATVDRLLSS
jgi:CheY-like chemotaxis protein